MNLKPKIKKLADAHESVHGFYTKTEDGFVLNVEMVDGFGLGPIDALKADNDRLGTACEGVLRDDALNKAIIAAGGNAALLGAHLRDRVKVDRKTLKVSVLRGDGTPLYNNKGEVGTIADLVAEARGNEAFARAFAEPETTKPEKPVNPWGEGTFTDHLRAVAAERASAPKPRHDRPVILDPKVPGFNITTAMSWAKGDAAREGELRRAMSGSLN